MTFVDDFAPTSLRLTEESPTLWRVTFDNPPVNLIGTDMMRDLKALLTELESNDTVNVVVFDSADPDFYLAHYDLAADHAASESAEPYRLRRLGRRHGENQQAVCGHHLGDPGHRARCRQ